MSSKNQDCGKKQNPKANANSLLSKSVQDLRKEVKQVYPFKQRLREISRKELCDMLNKKCHNLGGLVNKQNSCYLDSTLMSLLHDTSPYIKKYILDVDLESLYRNQPETLLNLAKRIQRGLNLSLTGVVDGTRFYCEKLREIFHKYDTYYRNHLDKSLEHVDWISSQLEPEDVIKILGRVFKLGDHCRLEFKTFGYEKKKYLVTNEIRARDIAAIKIPGDILYRMEEDNEEYDMGKMLFPVSKTYEILDKDNLWRTPTIPGKAFSKKMEYIKYLEAPMLIISAQRNFADTKIATPIMPLFYMKLKYNTRRLTLSSIICHHGNSVDYGHYTAFLLCKNDWYHYDDMGYKKLKHIGNEEDLLKWGNGFVVKNSVTFIYI
jgi:hypothetical protein